ncbi:MAG: hypothetical protein RIF33_13485 [Cyclobacteriaceae bacterium]
MDIITHYYLNPQDLIVPTVLFIVSCALVYDRFFRKSIYSATISLGMNISVEECYSDLFTARRAYLLIKNNFSFGIQVFGIRLYNEVNNEVMNHIPQPRILHKAILRSSKGLRLHPLEFEARLYYLKVKSKDTALPTEVRQACRELITYYLNLKPIIVSDYNTSVSHNTPSIEALAHYSLLESNLLSSKDSDIPNLGGEKKSMSKHYQIVKELNEALGKYNRQLIEFSETSLGKRCISVDENGAIYVDITVQKYRSVGLHNKKYFAYLILTILKHEGILNKESGYFTIDIARAAYDIFDLEWKKRKPNEFYNAIVNIDKPNDIVIPILKALKNY